MRKMIRSVLKVIAFPSDSWTLNFTAWLRSQNQKRNDLHRFVDSEELRWLTANRFRAMYGTAAGTADIGLSAEASLWSATRSPLAATYVTGARS